MGQKRKKSQVKMDQQCPSWGKGTEFHWDPRKNRWNTSQDCPPEDGTPGHVAVAAATLDEGDF